MNFTPRSEKELSEVGLLPEGVYSFEVIEAQDKISKAGKEMIAIQLKIWDMDGKVHIIYDYLLEAMAYKLRHFAEGVGLIDKYNAGKLSASDCVRKAGKSHIIIQEGQPKPEGGNYPNKNSVKDYIKLNDKEVVNTLETKEDFFNDDVPF